MADLILLLCRAGDGVGTLIFFKRQEDGVLIFSLLVT